MQTKAYIALITKWYVIEIFSTVLPPAEASESSSYDVTAIYDVTSKMTS